MKRAILFRPEAEAELEDALRWYEKRRGGLGSDLLLCIEETLEKVRRTPEIYPVVHANVRRALVHRFPYGIFFVDEGETIDVVAVFHGSRDPQQLSSRFTD